MGKLQDDPVVDVYEQTGDSTTYTKFVLVNGPDRGKVTKIAVIAAGLVAQITAGLKKGQQVLVIGKLQTFTWDDGDGTKEKRENISRCA